jgi:hypothetical protein
LDNLKKLCVYWWGQPGVRGNSDSTSETWCSGYMQFYFIFSTGCTINLQAISCVNTIFRKISTVNRSQINLAEFWMCLHLYPTLCFTMKFFMYVYEW